MKKNILYICCLLCFGVANGQAPAFEWAKNFGGISSTSFAYTVALDKSSNVYTMGSFYGTVDFDPSSSVFNIISDPTSSDIFISKLDQYGNFVWAKKVGGTMQENGFSIVVDSIGSVYITGYFQGVADFDPGIGVFNLSSVGPVGALNMFISKLDSLGNFVWAKNLGGTSDDEVFSIAFDAFNNILATGFFQGTVDFDPGVGVYNLTTGGKDAFVLNLDTSGDFIWAKQFAGIGMSGGCVGASVLTNSDGSIFTIGSFQGIVDFDPDSTVFSLTSSGINDVFVTKLNSSGSFVWARKIGGIGNDQGVATTLDAFGNILITGSFEDLVDFNPNGGIANLISDSASSNLFILKLDTASNFVWVKNIGRTGNNSGNSIAVDVFGNVYATGNFAGTSDFDPGLGVFNLTSFGYQDICILKLDALGDFLWAKNIEGNGINSRGTSIAIDTSGNLFFTGYFDGVADFDFGLAVYNLTSLSGEDVFVLKLSQTPTGINEAITPNNISIYPNPNNGIFNISFASQIKNASIEVYNSLGSLVYKQEIINQENSIELSNEASGLYFVKVMSENKIVGMGKIVKQ